MKIIDPEWRVHPAYLETREHLRAREARQREQARFWDGVCVGIGVSFLFGVLLAGAGYLWERL